MPRDSKTNLRSPKTTHRHAATRRRRQSRDRGLSIVELLMALAISAMLLTATTLAIDASFKAYASAAQTASTQTSTRMVTHRLLAMLRNSSAHEPMTLAYAQSVDAAATQTNDIIEANFMELVDSESRRIRVRWDSATQQLWVDRLNLISGTVTDSQPILDNVSNARFMTNTRLDSDGVIVLERGSMDLTVQIQRDDTLTIESDDLPPLRIVASTKPRRVE